MDDVRFFCTYLCSAWKILQVEHMLVNIHVIGYANAWKVTRHNRMRGAGAARSAWWACFESYFARSSKSGHLGAWTGGMAQYMGHLGVVQELGQLEEHRGFGR